MLRHLSSIQQSYSVAFADFVRLRESQGCLIVKMQTGDPDFDTHPVVVKAAQDALQKGATKYCESRGLMSFRKALAEKVFRENRISADPNENILVTHGAVSGIGMAIRALVNPGDECIIIEPYWRAYEANIILCGGKPVVVKANREDGFRIKAEQIAEKITNATRLIIINTPNNPSGAVYDENELKKIAKQAADKGIYIISDEVYESIVFNGASHYSMASDPDASNWIISVFSFSKTHAMTGWRIGYLVAAKKIVDEILKLSQFSQTSLAPYSQLAATHALEHPESVAYSKAMVSEYETRRNFIRDSFDGTWLKKAGVIPAGTFYVLINMELFGFDSLSLAKQLVDKGGVSFTPGIAFGDSMDGFLRMCFATSLDNIGLAIESLIKFEKSFVTERVIR